MAALQAVSNNNWSSASKGFLARGDGSNEQQQEE
jgi:hypothetical protein